MYLLIPGGLKTAGCHFFGFELIHGGGNSSHTVGDCPGVQKMELAVASQP